MLTAAKRRPKAEARFQPPGRRYRRFGTSRRSISRGPRTARRCGRRSSRCACSSGDRIRSSIDGQEIDTEAGGSIPSTPATARGSWGRSRWPESTHAEAAVAAARRRFPAWSATPPAEARGRPDRGGQRSCASAGSSWRRGRSSNAASPGPRPTATSPRPSTSANSTRARCAGWPSRRHRDASGRDEFYRAHRPRRRRGHPALELPAGDPDRHDGRRAGHRQHRHPEAGRAVAGHRAGTWHEILREAGLPRGRAQLSSRASARRPARRWSTIPTSI